MTILSFQGLLAVFGMTLEPAEAHLTKVRALFQQLGSDENSVITFRQLLGFAKPFMGSFKHPSSRFEDKINSEEVREYFETLGLDVWDAWSFFKLLDRAPRPFLSEACQKLRTAVVPSWPQMASREVAAEGPHVKKLEKD